MTVTKPDADQPKLIITASLSRARHLRGRMVILLCCMVILLCCVVVLLWGHWGPCVPPALAECDFHVTCCVPCGARQHLPINISGDDTSLSLLLQADRPERPLVILLIEKQIPGAASCCQYELVLSLDKSLCLHAYASSGDALSWWCFFELRDFLCILCWWVSSVCL